MSIRKEDTMNSIDIALIIGTLLNIVNQFQALISLDPSTISISKVFLTYLVPFLVLLLYPSISNTGNRHVEN
jgi:hypothetical protein